MVLFSFSLFKLISLVKIFNFVKKWCVDNLIDIIKFIGDDFDI